METKHHIKVEDSREIEFPEVELVVTSPPYPMVEMWDDLFDVEGSPREQFTEMHHQLNEVWGKLDDCVVEGGYVCINIGNATRSMNGEFQLFNNASYISSYMTTMDFVQLPYIIWKKTTNSPNSFMGSGMSPPNQYITNEHEYILIFRKGGSLRNPETRHESSYFFEERNEWFSETWFVKGASQTGNAEYPLEIPYRLINMFSAYGDTVLDPFLGTGTTTLAAIASARNSIGYDIKMDIREKFVEKLKLSKLQERQLKRVEQHQKIKSDVYKYESSVGRVSTKNQRDMVLYKPTKIEFSDKIEVQHEPIECGNRGLLDY